jgi:predicted metalloprotease with PDZ domain
MMKIPWQDLMLCPAGFYVRDLPVRTTRTRPAGFFQASSLKPVAPSGDRIEYKATTIERLVDSPGYAGRYFKAIELAANAFLAVIDDSSPLSRMGTRVAR